MDHFHLDLLGQGIGGPCRIHGYALSALWLDKDVVGIPVSKLDDLILDGRAVAYTGSVDMAAVHGTAGEIGFDDLVGFFRRVGQVARDLIPADRPGNRPASFMFHVEHSMGLIFRRFMFHVEHFPVFLGRPGEEWWGNQSLLALHSVIIDAILVKPGRGACFQAGKPKPQ